MKAADQLRLIKFGGIRLNGISFSGSPAAYLGRAGRNMVRPMTWSFPTFAKLPGIGNLIRKADDHVMPNLVDKVHPVMQNKLTSFNKDPNILGRAIPGLDSVWLNPNSRGYGSVMSRRDTIAHEAFHAKNNLLGPSESLARFYGGFRRERNAPLLQNLRNGIRNVSEYWSSPYLRSVYGVSGVSGNVRDWVAKNILTKVSSIAVDLDGTLAHHPPGVPFDGTHVGTPVPKMLARVKRWISEGKEVKIFTARAADPDNIPPIRRWLKEHGIPGCEITNQKTPDIERIYDDRAVKVYKNRGHINKKASTYFDVARALDMKISGWSEHGQRDHL